MNASAMIQPKPAYHHLKHPGGRLTKIGGQAVSLAPQLGQAAVSLGSSVSRIALGATLALAASASASFAACDELPPGVWTCGGSLTTTQDITAPAGLGLDISTTPGFEITTATGLGFNLLTNAGDLGLTFNDAYGSAITGAVRGINARSQGTGALSITTTGTVEGVDNAGIYAVGYGLTTGLTISTAEVSGRTHGIVANNAGSGVTSVTATGDVTGTLSEGILAAGSGTNLTVSADTVTGGTHGIYARNVGTGELSVTTTGTITGNGVTGIFANNTGTGTNLTISAAAVTGDTDGIYAANSGSGATSITATDDVTGTRGRGIVARNTATAMSDVTINAAGVTGYNYGIFAQNSGTAALSITTTGEVRATGANSTGIHAENGADATTLTINADAASGQNYGINAINSGSGSLSITATGAVLGTDLVGILAYNGVGDGLSINSAEVAGRVYGVGAIHYGSGELSVTSSGAVRATHGDGILAVSHGSDLTVSATEVTGMHSGIRAYNYGSGALSVTATGDVRGDSDYGISALNDRRGTDLTIYAATVTGGTRGINAHNYGSGAISITASGAVTSGRSDGIHAYNDVTGTDITVAAAAVSGGSDGIDVHNYGSGEISITATSEVIGADDEGIHAINTSAGTGITISTAEVTGYDIGIEARNSGTGALSITSTGLVTGQNGAGILGTNSNYGTDLTISAAAVSGNGFGIDARNNGTGALSITSTGDVTSAASDGIYATNYAASTDLTISTASVTGYNDGISAFSSGSGAFSITTTGEVTGTNRYGIAASNRNGTDTSISTAAVTGGTHGIIVFNYGSGDFSISATGQVTAANGNGIFGYNSSAGSNQTISTAAVSGSVIGIGAYNRGSGVLSITSTGAVTGTDGDGISATNTGTDLTVAAAGVSGGSRGIYALNNGSGALSITATGNVIGATRDGIYANNRATGTDLSVSAALVTGYDTGIEARHSGTGVLSITATGLVTGQTGAGILGTNSSYGTDLTISSDAVSGNGIGIDARNNGTGELSIASTGDVTSAASDGIYATNYAASTDLTISAHNVTGYGDGINAFSSGSGAVSITTTGQVTGTGSFGISAENSGTDMTINAHDVTGANRGINATHHGSGALSITTTGHVSTPSRSALAAYVSSNGTDLTIAATTVSGGARGVDARNFGSGTLSITTSGDVTARSRAIVANNQGTELTIATTSATGGYDGIFAENHGRGALSITASGAVTGTARYGIYGYNSNAGTDLKVSATSASGGYNGIIVYNYGSGDTSVTASGIVTGGTGAAIGVFANSGSSAEITLNSGADVSSGSGIALRNNESDSISTFNSGSKVTGEVQLADGSDTLVLAGGDASDVTLFDGGDDRSAADGFIDTVQVTGLGYDLAGASFTNWEVFSVEGGSVAFNDTALTVGDGITGTGVSVEQGGMISTGGDFTLNALLSTDTGSIFNAAGGGRGSVILNGDVSNNGILTSQDDAAGDVITIAGNYSGSGVVGLDAALGNDASTSDVLEVQGDTSGADVLSIFNVGGGGDVTSRGIEVISVVGNSNGVFTLAGDYETSDGEQAIVGGVYAYTLARGDNGNWLLQSTDDDGEPRYQPGTPIYDSYAQSLLSLNGTSSLRHRGTSLDYRQQAAAENSSPVQRLTNLIQKTPLPFWIELGLDDISTAQETSSFGTATVSTVWELQAGADTIVSEGDTGFLVGGLILNYAKSDTKVDSEIGSGSIDSTGTGLTLAATWYDYRGFYIDGQFKYSRYNSDLKSAALGALEDGNDGSGYALSVEVGQEYPIESDLTLVPQAQLTQSSIDFDSFTGLNGEQVSLENADSLLLRIGVEVDKNNSLEKGEQRLYGIANIFHEFGDGTVVDVSGVSLANSGDDWAGEIGLGGNYSWDDAYSVYGEVSYTTGLQNFGDNQKVSANIGFRMEF